jgi:hypothetical protein
MIAKTATSEYLLLFRNTSWHNGLSPEEIQQNLARFTAWFEQLRDDRKFKGGGPLVYDGKIVTDRNAVTDGPFAESKEAIGGFLIIQADSLEQAVQIAEDCPGFRFGQTVEVRPIGPDLSAREKVRDKRTRQTNSVGDVPGVSPGTDI